MWLYIHFLWLPQLYVRKLILLHQQMNTISYQFEQLGESFPNGTIQQSQRQNKRDNVSKDCTRTNDTVQHKLKNLNKKWFNQRNIYLQTIIHQAWDKLWIYTFYTSQFKSLGSAGFDSCIITKAAFI